MLDHKSFSLVQNAHALLAPGYDPAQVCADVCDATLQLLAELLRCWCRCAHKARLALHGAAYDRQTCRRSCRRPPLTATSSDLRCGRCPAGAPALAQVHQATQAVQPVSRHGWLQVRHPAAPWTAWLCPHPALRSASPACTRSSPPQPPSWMPTTMTPATAPLLCSCYGDTLLRRVVLDVL